MKREPKYIGELRRLEACSQAIDWCLARKLKTPIAAWKACRNPSYLLWVIGQNDEPKGSPYHTKIVKCAKEFAANAKNSARAASGAVGYAVGYATKAAARAARSAARAAASEAACDASEAASYTANDAASDAASCDIIRKHFPRPPRIKKRKG